MAEFTLPANSKVKIGDTYKGPADAGEMRAFKVYRYDPDNGEEFRFIINSIDI